jgi:hypothetical protein
VTFFFTAALSRVRKSFARLSIGIAVHVVNMFEFSKWQAA